MKSNVKKIQSAFIFLILILCSCSFAGCDSRKFKLPKETLEISKSDGEVVKVVAELAVKPEERNYGYMNRKNIPDGTGMLFVFEKDQLLHFWMKNTPHPLSIAYLDSKGKIIDIYDMTPFALANISSSRSVRYALEVPQGWYKNNGIKPGDFVSLPKGKN